MFNLQNCAVKTHKILNPSPGYGIGRVGQKITYNMSKPDEGREDEKTMKFWH
jgi:hypothetical protein